jgi:hypothetical protein
MILVKDTNESTGRAPQLVANIGQHMPKGIIEVVATGLLDRRHLDFTRSTWGPILVSGNLDAPARVTGCLQQRPRH